MVVRQVAGRWREDVHGSSISTSVKGQSNPLTTLFRFASVPDCLSFWAGPISYLWCVLFCSSEPRLAPFNLLFWAGLISHQFVFFMLSHCLSISRLSLWICSVFSLLTQLFPKGHCLCHRTLRRSPTSLQPQLIWNRIDCWNATTPNPHKLSFVKPRFQSEVSLGTLNGEITTLFSFEIHSNYRKPGKHMIVQC